MANLPTTGTEVQYFFGTEEKYQSLETKSDYAFYYTGENLYLGTWKLTTESDVDQALDSVGDLSALTTSEKSSLVAAINEIVASGGGGTYVPATDTTAGVVKLYSTTGTATDGTISQAALTEELEKKAEINSTIADETLVINI